VEGDETSSRPRSHKTGESTEKLWNLALSDRHLNIRALLTQLNLEKKQ
jgi:hypothetical protein